MEVCSYICSSAHGNYPAGVVYFAPSDLSDEKWVKADGRYLSVDEYHDLFQVVGNLWCKPILREEVPAGLIELLRRAIGLNPRVEYVERENPEYRKGYFRLPQLAAFEL